MGTKEKFKEKQNYRIGSSGFHYLVLHNDDYHTFDFVIDSLIDVCKHDSEQAEQCALITHYHGKCDIKKGGFEELSDMKSLLENKGLSITID